MDWDLSRRHGPRCPDLSRQAGPFAAKFDGTDSVVARTEVEALAAGSVLLSPLLALSYFGILDGAEQLRSGTVRAWAAPARDLIS